MPETINIPVMGAGCWGTKLIEEYLRLSKKWNDVELVAIADESTERLLMFGKCFLCQVLC